MEQVGEVESPQHSLEGWRLSISSPACLVENIRIELIRPTPCKRIPGSLAHPPIG